MVDWIRQLSEGEAGQSLAKAEAGGGGVLRAPLHRAPLHCRPCSFEAQALHYPPSLTQHHQQVSFFLTYLWALGLFIFSVVLQRRQPRCVGNWVTLH